MDGDERLSDETWGDGSESPRDLDAQLRSLERTRARIGALQPSTAFARAFALPPTAAEAPWAGGGGAAPAAPAADPPRHPLSDSLQEDDVLADVLGPAAEPGGGAFRQLPPAYCIPRAKMYKVALFCSRDPVDTKGGNTRSTVLPL